MAGDRPPTWYAIPPPTGRAYIELAGHLQEQIRFLESSARAYDEGNLSEAKRLSTTLRTLLHGGKAALLSQLGLVAEHSRRGLWFMDTAHTLPVGAIPVGGQALLCVMEVARTGDGTTAHYAPACVAPPIPNQREKTLPFQDWWNAVVVVTQNGDTFSRKRLVLALANKEGGAHVDPDIPADYRGLTREGAMGHRVTPDGVEAAIVLDGGYPLPGDSDLDPVPASVRQISHEVLLSLRGLHPEMVQYVPPPTQALKHGDGAISPTPTL